MEALEAGDDRDLLAILEAGDQLTAVNIEDTGRSVGIRGLDRDLPALPGARLDADGLQRDRQQAGGNLFAGGDDGVVFPRIVQRRSVGGPGHQFVGLAGHRGNHDGHVMTGIDLALDVKRDVANAVDVRDGCTAEFHNEPAHDEWCIP